VAAVAPSIQVYFLAMPVKMMIAIALVMFGLNILVGEIARLVELDATWMNDLVNLLG
jgi:flagellar biosynthesis protein FliR